MMNRTTTLDVLEGGQDGGEVPDNPGDTLLGVVAVLLIVFVAVGVAGVFGFATVSAAAPIDWLFQHAWITTGFLLVIAALLAVSAERNS